MPVLSISTVRVCPIASNAAPSLTTTPFRAAQAIPDTTATGAASTSGHGVATTSTASIRVDSPVSSQVPPAIRNTIGTNITAYRSASRTNGARPTPADLTSFTIPAYELSAAEADADIRNAPPAFSDPLRAGSPLSRCTDWASPVSTDSSSTAVSSTVPSTGTTSPGLTSSTSSGTTSSTGTVSNDPSTSRWATFGASDSNSDSDRSARRSAYCSRASPDATIKARITPASASSITIAATKATSATTSTATRPSRNRATVTTTRSTTTTPDATDHTATARSSAPPIHAAAPTTNAVATNGNNARRQTATTALTGSFSPVGDDGPQRTPESTRQTPPRSKNGRHGVRQREPPAADHVQVGAVRVDDLSVTTRRGTDPVRVAIAGQV